LGQDFFKSQNHFFQKKSSKFLSGQWNKYFTTLEKFQLTPAQQQTLRAAPTDSLNDTFFDALERVQEIHSKVKILLRSNQQTAGLEIMEEMALHQEAGYERLYRKR